MFLLSVFASLLASVLVIIAERHIDFRNKVKFIYRRLYLAISMCDINLDYDEKLLNIYKVDLISLWVYINSLEDFNYFLSKKLINKTITDIGKLVAEFANLAYLSDIDEKKEKLISLSRKLQEKIGDENTLEERILSNENSIKSWLDLADKIKNLNNNETE